QQESLRDKDLSTIGFLGYPLLQTADVAIYDAKFVPVGEDQVAHLELAREVVRRFNNFFPGGDGQPVLVEPQPLLTTFARLPGLDGGKKMSKSVGNTIHLSDTADEVKKKVMHMYTDPKRVRADIPGTVEGNPVFIYHDAFNPNTAEVDDLKERYRTGKVGDVEVKTKLAAALNARLDPIRERRAALLAKPGQLTEILFDGSARARTIPAHTMQHHRRADDGARSRGDEDLVPKRINGPFAFRVRVGARRVSGQARVVRGTARFAAAPHQEERGQHPRHSDRARHAAVPRRHRADAG